MKSVNNKVEKKVLNKMANNKTVRKYSDYVSGSAARQLSVALPEKQAEPKKRISQETVRNREKILQIRAGYMMFLAVATIVLGVFCYSYLNMKADISGKSKNIAKLTTAVDTLTAQNDSLDYSVNSYVDTNNIIKVATEELGMVKASGNQISYYKSTESEFMKQFTDVPSE